MMILKRRPDGLREGDNGEVIGLLVAFAIYGAVMAAVLFWMAR